MNILKTVLLAEIVGLILLSLSFFRLSAAPELATINQHFITATTILSEISAPQILTEKQPAGQSWNMVAVGDIMLDRYVRTVLKTKGVEYPFAAIKPVLVDHDVVLGNLEGPFTKNASVATDTRLIFTFDPNIAPTLTDVGFTDLSLANNHTLNFGQTGLDQTRQVLRSAGLNYFGDPSNRHGFGFIREVAGRKVAFIGYNALSKGVATILSDIQEARGLADVVVVVPHWGNEYQLKFNNRQQSEAHQLIDAGADLILGAHPHVVQPFEIYKDKFIAYSLGNFLFDQYFSSDTLEGLMLRLTFSPESLAIILVPIVTERGQIHLLTGARRDTLLARLAKDSDVQGSLREEIKQGRMIIPSFNRLHP